MPRSHPVTHAVLAAALASMVSAPALAQTARLSLADLQAQILALRSGLTCPPALPGEPRFRDKGDGTFCDAKTGLQWETKVTDSASQNWYLRTSTWSSPQGILRDGSLFTDWLPAINQVASSIVYTQAWPTENCLGGHCDWRVPTVDEMRSLVCPDSSTSCYADVPLPGQTAVGGYWTTTAVKTGPAGAETSLAFAWYFNGVQWRLQQDIKSSQWFMRAVRSTR